MPYLQKEKECYKKAIIQNGRDSFTGRTIKEPRTWPRDPAPGELAYYKWVKLSTDDRMNWNPVRDEKGNPVKGTGARYLVDQINRVRTADGEFLLSIGRLKGYDNMGNKTGKSCNSPEKWSETLLNFTRTYDSSGQTIVQCTGPSGSKIHYEMPFNIDNLRKLVKQRAGDNIPLVLKDELTSENPVGMPKPISIANVKTLVSSNKFSSELIPALLNHREIAAMTVPAIIDAKMLTFFLFSQLDSSDSDSIISTKSLP